jgi:hypothetical protein
MHPMQHPPRLHWRTAMGDAVWSTTCVDAVWELTWERAESEGETYQAHTQTRCTRHHLLPVRSRSRNGPSERRHYESARRGSASVTSSRLRLQVFARRLTVAHHRLKRSGLPKSSCRQFRRLTTKSCPGQSCASHGMLCRRRRWIARRPNANATRGPVHCLHNPDPEL